MEPTAAATAATESTEDDVIINLKLLKMSGYYDLVVPDRCRGKPLWSLFGRSGHRVCFVAMFAFAQCLVLYANAGFALPVDYTFTEVEFLLILFADLMHLMMIYKTCLLFYRVCDVATLLDMTRFDFLSSEACRRNRGTVLHDCRTRVVRFTNKYCMLCIVVMFQWIVSPILVITFGGVGDTYKAAGKRIPGVVNLPFPVTVRTYNRYFPLFLGIESILDATILYCNLMIDMYMLSYGWIITAQYEVLARAFEQLGQRRAIDGDDDDSDVNTYEELKSILADQLKLTLKFKTFKAVARPIILTIVAVSSVIIVIMTYAFVVIYSTPDLFSIDYLFRVSNIDFYLCVQLYLYCNLMDKLNEKRDSVNVAIYSCNWTGMDLKVKKILLLAMRMNDVNPLYMNASPLKIINLQLFAGVMRTCYSITSVMANSQSTKNSSPEPTLQ